MTDNSDDRILGRGGNEGRAADPTADCALARELIPARALGVLPTDEATRLDRHLVRCPGCRAELTAQTRTATLLPFLAPPATPAPDLKAPLFARIAHAQRAASDAAARPTPLPSPTPTLPASRPTVAPPSPPPGRRWLPPLGALGQGRLARSAFALPLTAVPLALALVVVAGWAVLLHNRASDRSAQVESLQGQLATMNGLLAAGGAVYDLTAGPAAPRAVGKLYVNSASRQAMLVVHGLSGAPGTTYTVYVEQDGKMIPLQQLSVGRDGSAQCLLSLDLPAGRYQGLHIRAQAGNASGLTTVADTLSTTINPAPTTAFSLSSTMGEPDLGSGR